MITLHQFQPAYGLPNLSPFCMKVETYLRMAGLPYRTANVDLRKAPKGKAPYIEDSGKLIPDSELIIEYLKSTYGDKLDAGLSAEQRAAARALQRMLDEHFYWTVLYSRWFVEENWVKVRQAFFGGMTIPLRWIIPPLARASLKKQLWGHGMGRHSGEEIYALGRQDITALADFLGDRPYFMGDQPCLLDATAYSYLANILWVPMSSPLREHAQKYPHLEAYCQRMKTRYFPPS